MTNDPGRSVFVGLQRNLYLSIVHVAMAVALIVGGVVFLVQWFTGAPYPVPNAAIGILGTVGGAFGLLISVVTLLQWTKPFHVAFDDAGVQVLIRGRDVRIPWSDIASVYITDRNPNGTRLPMRRFPDERGVRTRWLVATPAPHVADPGAGDRAHVYWLSRWSLCATHTVSGTEAQMAAAIRAASPRTPLDVAPVDNEP
ncbi:hypothetical protein ACFOVU_26685 [Nocardiopsis sediminis]|uniref:PH domain-containing protein n=1 Tax=Nocardiopsis sediminis TaxID=1778267 RepID=A0ABV8FYG4_9ACTN